jgi:hypothetical protein
MLSSIPAIYRRSTLKGGRSTLQGRGEVPLVRNGLSPEPPRAEYRLQSPKRCGNDLRPVRRT